MGYQAIGRHQDGTPWGVSDDAWQFNPPSSVLAPAPIIRMKLNQLFRARQRKDYQASDDIRAWLTERGVTVETDKITVRAKW